MLAGYEPFLANPVGEIHQESNLERWRHVPTASSLADNGTRGLTVTRQNNSDCWWNGPKGLQGSREHWPEVKFESPASEAFKEVKPKRRMNAAFVVANKKNDEKEERVWQLEPTRFSKSYRKPLTTRLEFGTSLVRVRGWAHLFLKNCRKPKDERMVGQLTPEELKQVEEQTIKRRELMFTHQKSTP